MYEADYSIVHSVANCAGSKYVAVKFTQQSTVSLLLQATNWKIYSFSLFFFYPKSQSRDEAQFRRLRVTKKSKEINPVLYFLTEQPRRSNAMTPRYSTELLQDKISPFSCSVFSISCMRVLSLLCSGDPATRVRETFSSRLKA